MGEKLQSERRVEGGRRLRRIAIVVVVVVGGDFVIVNWSLESDFYIIF